MGWIAITLPATPDQADRLSDALMDFGALSVSIEDAAAGTANEHAVFGEPGSATQALWHECHIVCLFPEKQQPELDIPLLLSKAADQAGYPLGHYTQAHIADQDWVRATQSQFNPIPIGDRLWIVPSWHAFPDPSAISIQLDPGLAFGTGSHPTTRLCLEWLVDHIAGGETVLDYGCGSGILAIAAAKLGAQSVLGIDIDLQAVLTARENAFVNCGQDYVLLDAAEQPSLQDNGPTQDSQLSTPEQSNQAHQPPRRVCFISPESDPGGQYEVVVANILTNPLRTLAPLIAAHCRIGGRLVLSGILADQSALIQAAYADWFNLTIWAESEGWVCLTGTRQK